MEVEVEVEVEVVESFWATCGSGCSLGCRAALKTAVIRTVVGFGKILLSAAVVYPIVDHFMMKTSRFQLRGKEPKFCTDVRL